MNPKIEINLMERKTGKTSKIIERINNEFDNCILFQIHFNITSRTFLNEFEKDVRLNFFNFHHDNLKGLSDKFYKNILIDDYFFTFDHVKIKKFYNDFYFPNKHKIENIIIYSSLLKKLDFFEFSEVKEFKNGGDINLDEKYKNSKLLYNLITEPNVKVNNYLNQSIF